MSTSNPIMRPPKARLFVEEALAANASLVLDGGQASYLVNVMRLRPGDALLLFNGRDGEWQGRVERAARQSCRVDVALQVRRQRAELGPWLVFAPIKKTGVDFIAEKATELGASRLWPVFTRNTAAARINLERLRAHAIEAAEQCERLTVPDVESPLQLEALAGRWPPDRPLLVLDARGDAAPLAKALTEIGHSGPPPGILVGPEGGLTASEMQTLGRSPFVARVTLGRRILRAETAALAALACWQVLAGDWAGC
jgi:16S rRNA (uracil1498-N3)-methyltransferase